MCSQTIVAGSDDGRYTRVSKERNDESDSFIASVALVCSHVVAKEPVFAVFKPRLQSRSHIPLLRSKQQTMKKNIFRSIGAVLAGLIFIGATHTAIDAILESNGVLPKGHLNVSASLIIFVIFYRAVFSFAGCYLTARLAPSGPMKHSMILGAFGTVLSVVGAIATASMNIAPAYYGWSLVVMALPIAWLAGKLYAKRNERVSAYR